MISQDHVIEGSCDFVTQWSYPFAKFGCHRHCGSEDIMILVCHVVSQNHVIKESFDFIGKGIKISYHPAKIGSHIHCDS